MLSFFPQLREALRLGLSGRELVEQPAQFDTSYTTPPRASTKMGIDDDTLTTSRAKILTETDVRPIIPFSDSR